MAPFEFRGGGEDAQDLGGSRRRQPVSSGKPISSTSFPGDRALNKWHGTLREEDYPPPRVMAKTANEGRPGYHAVNASEYMDQHEVLKAKLQSVAGLLRRGKANVIYSGAGLSTSSGMGDYASKA